MGVSSVQSTNRGIFSFVRQIKPPKLGELREPLSFFESNRIPVKNEDGTEGYHFDQTVEPYFNAWGKSYQFQGNYLDGQNVENNLSHIFLIRRDPEISIESKCYILWNEDVYVVRGVRNVEDPAKEYKGGFNFLLILCDEMGSFYEENRIVLDSTAPDDGAPNDTVDVDNPLWR